MIHSSYGRQHILFDKHLLLLLFCILLFPYYFFVEDDKFIGVIHIRIRLTEGLLKYGGHIGYGINPLYWNKGYGTKLLKMGLEKAKELVKEDKILITCDDDNIGSYKIIENNGGVLENKVTNTDAGETFITRRYWIEK